ncbi:apiosidase-like domain-containing protein, partial [Nocardioides sp. AN3]
MRPRIASIIVAALAATASLIAGVGGVGARDAAASVSSVAATAPDPPYFADRIGGTGKPVFIFSAEDWGILSNGGTAAHTDYNTSYDHYFATRAAQGYNGVEVSMFSQTNLAGGHNGPDGDGVYPWGTSSLDPTQAPNATFWARRDHFISQAAAKGFYVFLNASTAMLDQGA